MSERGIYRSIPQALLSGREFRLLPERARWVFVVLKLNIGPTGIDTWYPEELLARISAETGASAHDVARALDVLEESGWIEREDNLLWVKRQLSDDPHLTSANPKHRTSVQRHIAGLPRAEIVTRFCTEHSDWIPIDEGTAMGIEWVSNGYTDGSGIRSRKKKKRKIAGGVTAEGTLSQRSPFAFMGVVRGVWSEAYGGQIPPGSAKQLEPLVREHGEEEVSRRLGIYCGSTNAAYASVPKFVSTFGAWQSQPAREDESRLIGVGGNPTPEELESVGIRIR